LSVSTAYKDWLFRVSHILKTYSLITIFLLLSACGRLSGDWPNLAEPFPDASERNRVFERSKPVDPVFSEDKSPLTRSTAFKLLESTRTKLETAKTVYLNARAKISDSSGEEQLINWNEAQLSLTRLSYTASRLDSILETENLKGTPVLSNSQILKSEQDVFLVAERRALAALKP